MISKPQLLSDPFLQLPTETSVRVVWFTEFAGSQHSVAYGDAFNCTALATTSKLSRTREDQLSRVSTKINTEETRHQEPTWRPIWRHEAEVTGLNPNTRVPYRVTSVREDGESVSSNQFTLAAKPTPGVPLKILLTSDHQQKPMTAANLQKVVETIGRVDAVFFAGDLVNVADRASEWFDDSGGSAFFPCLQGRANYLLKNGANTTYTGGCLIQHAPLFTALGNHEVMGRFSLTRTLNDQFYDAIPHTVAEQLFQEKYPEIPINTDVETKETWLKNNSFNTDTYEEILTLPQSSQGGKKYYALSFGDVYLIVLYATFIWRVPQLGVDAQGRYHERERDFNNPENWGYGQHIFEPIAEGSLQYNWLRQELSSPEFKQAKYKVVMLHHPPHTLGDNILPAYTDPVQFIERDGNGNIQAVRYKYPKEANYLIRDVMPLVEAAGVQLVLFGHSHLWNRFVGARGTHFLETSNVGNSYGAAFGDNQRPIPTDCEEDYALTGDPYGLAPVVPTIAPLIGKDGQPMPYIASNDITVFSILDTHTGTVSSYRFDTKQPTSQVVKFDEFKLNGDE